MGEPEPMRNSEKKPDSLPAPMRDEFTFEEVCQSLAEFVSREAWGEFVVVVQGGRIRTMETKRILKPRDRG